MVSELYSPRSFIRIAIIVVASSLISLGFGGCSMDMSEVCAERFPRIEQGLSTAMAALEPWRSGRAPASGGPVAPISMEQLDRQSWQRWAEERLAEMQGYIDLTTGEPGAAPIRQELTEVANELVTFHGYAQTGRADRMTMMLERMQARVAKVRGLACSPALANTQARTSSR